MSSTALSYELSLKELEQEAKALADVINHVQQRFVTKPWDGVTTSDKHIEVISGSKPRGYLCLTPQRAADLWKWEFDKIISQSDDKALMWRIEPEICSFPTSFTQDISLVTGIKGNIIPVCVWNIYARFCLLSD